MEIGSFWIWFPKSLIFKRSVAQITWIVEDYTFWEDTAAIILLLKLIFKWPIKRKKNEVIFKMWHFHPDYHPYNCYRGWRFAKLVVVLWMLPYENINVNSLSNFQRNPENSMRNRGKFCSWRFCTPLLLIKESLFCFGALENEEKIKWKKILTLWIFLSICNKFWLLFFYE